MYTKWVGKNVDLKLLSSTIGDYFKEIGLTVDEYCSQNQHVIMIKFPHSGIVKVVVEGSPNDFSVESFFVKERYSSLIPYNLYSLFGGGAFLLYETRLKETLQNLEKDFSMFLERVMLRLINSNKEQESGTPS